MEPITTDRLNHKIKMATDIQDYLTENKNDMLTVSLCEHLNILLSHKKLRKADVVQGSLLERTYIYKIFAGRKKPSRDKLIAIAFGLRLSASETQKLLKISGNRELYAREERDSLILFSLYHEQTIFEANELLEEHHHAVLP